VQTLGFSELERDDGCSVDEEGFAAVGGKTVLDEVKEAALGQDMQGRRQAHWVHLLSIEFLEQVFQLVRRGK
jgi:hypothetical protein